MRIAVTGPECSGKSSLSNYLSRHFGLPLVEEYAREYLADRGRNYTENDLLQIAREQFRRNRDMDLGDGLICDTEMTVLKIWSMDKYGHCQPEIQDLMNAQVFDTYLLCYPDLVWEADDLREVPDVKRRLELFHQYEEEIRALGQSYTIIRGIGDARSELALKFLEDLDGLA